MIRLGLRLTFSGGRDAAVRLVTIALAVTIGVGMLLTALAGINATNAQNARYAWLNAAYAPTTAHPAGQAQTSGSRTATDPLWWLLQADHFQGQTIGRVDVAASGPGSPLPPGISRLPGPGQFYASPAMTKLLDSTPASELGDRYPGHRIGPIGSSALPAPNSLIIVIGYSATELSQQPGVDRVSSFATAVPGGCGCYSIGNNTNGTEFILAVVAAALLFPVLIFIGAASRLSAARREQRFAAMRLIGATPQQISTIATVESTLAATAGVIAGFGLFYLLRPAVASISFTGAPFFTGDLSLSLLDIVLVAVGVPVAAAIAARLALRRVRISPLGVTRRVTPLPPRAWRLIPLLAGIAELALFVVIGNPTGTPNQIAAFFPGFILIMIGLVVAGPWLTLVGSRIMVRRARRPATLIAARRLSDNPQAAFRAISGLVLALFVTAVAVGAITTWDANRATPSGGRLASGTLVEDFTGPQGVSSVATISSAVLSRISSLAGVEATTLIHLGAPTTPSGIRNVPLRPGLISCAELARTPALGRCPAGAQVVTTPPFVEHSAASKVWPAADVTLENLQAAPVAALAVSTDASASAVERARTAMQLAFATESSPATIAEMAHSQLDSEYGQLADVVILVSLPIAGASLAASIAAGLNDRKRPFSMLRLAGTPLRVLRRVVALESAVPLLISAVVATATGFLAAELFLQSQLGYTVRPPGISYYLIVVAGLAASLAIIASTLPLLRRITGPEAARND